MIDVSLYRYKEHAYADAFANALYAEPAFLKWVLDQTPLMVNLNARVLREEMIAKRPKAKFWWKNFRQGKCTCLGCSGSETDVFVVCADQNDRRFALHVEIKQPSDRFDPAKRQGERYRLRAACWARTAPKTVLPHDEASTILLCSSEKLAVFANEIANFDATITFETIAARFAAAIPSYSD